MEKSFPIAEKFTTRQKKCNKCWWFENKMEMNQIRAILMKFAYTKNVTFISLTHMWVCGHLESNRTNPLHILAIFLVRWSSFIIIELPSALAQCWRVYIYSLHVQGNSDDGYMFLSPITTLFTVGQCSGGMFERHQLEDKNWSRWGKSSEPKKRRLEEVTQVGCQLNVNDSERNVLEKNLQTSFVGIVCEKIDNSTSGRPALESKKARNRKDLPSLSLLTHSDSIGLVNKKREKFIALLSCLTWIMLI